MITAHPSAQLQAPAAGVITRWRVRENSFEPGVMTPRVLRAAGGSSFTGVARGAQVAVGTSQAVQTHATRLPIAAGELFGVDANTGPSATLSGASFRLGFPAIASGATGALNDVWNDMVLSVNADVEPDADGDRFGDETQDLALGGAPTAVDTEVGRIGPATPVTLTNRESAPITIASARVTGGDDFLLAADECSGATLDPGATCTVRVRFAPTAPGDRAATLAVRSTALHGTDVALTGTGAAPAAPQATTTAPDLVSILLADRLSVRRRRALTASVFSTVPGQANVRILRGTRPVRTFDAAVGAGRTRLRLPTRRLRAGRYTVALTVTAAGRTSSDTARLTVRRR